MYESVRVVTPLLRSDHKAVAAYAEHLQHTGKASTKKLYRKVMLAQGATCLISTAHFHVGL